MIRRATYLELDSSRAENEARSDAAEFCRKASSFSDECPTSRENVLETLGDEQAIPSTHIGNDADYLYDCLLLYS